MKTGESKRSSKVVRLALLTVSGIVLLAVVPAVSANALPKIDRKVDTAKTWNMATDFAANPKLNPAPDQYGNKGVWSWMYGSTNTPSTYTLDGYQSPGTTKSTCGVRQYAWGEPASPTAVEDPSLLYQTATIPAGSDSCAPRDSFKKDTITLAPGWTGNNTGGLDMVVGWTSPINGEVSISGKIKGIDPDENGISWELDQDTTVVEGPTNESNDMASVIGRVSVAVTKGQSLYLEIGDGSTSGGADEVLTTFTITS